jgi:uncharacterized protein YcgL (UPF0745 family)
MALSLITTILNSEQIISIEKKIQQYLYTIKQLQWITFIDYLCSEFEIPILYSLFLLRYKQEKEKVEAEIEKLANDVIDADGGIEKGIHEQINYVRLQMEQQKRKYLERYPTSRVRVVVMSVIFRITCWKKYNRNILLKNVY